MLAALGDIFKEIRDLFPRTINIGPGAQGLMKRGGKYRALNPRWYVYMPLWTEIEEFQINRQPLFIEEPIDVGGEVKIVRVRLLYEIIDLVLAAETSAGWDDTIDDLVAQLIHRGTQGGWKLKKFNVKVATALQEWGIKVLSCTYNVITPDGYKCHRHSGSIGNGHRHDNDE
tara:strand:- start:2204 stop:2719 length:516 start_codon:yes stop_codon:yes gene_type:complete